MADLEPAVLGIAADGTLLRWNASIGASWGIQRAPCRHTERPCGSFTGGLVDGVPEGRGVHTRGGGAFSQGGATHDGLFIGGQRHGRGVESNHSVSEICVGNWQSGQRDGLFTCHKQGDVWGELWRHGELRRSWPSKEDIGGREWHVAGAPSRWLVTQNLTPTAYRGLQGVTRQRTLFHGDCEGDDDEPHGLVSGAAPARHRLCEGAHD